jgi:hypothetical protein
MSKERPPARTPKVTRKQAEAYRRGTPASRRASLIVLLAFWLVVVGAALLLVFVFHKTLHLGGHI